MSENGQQPSGLRNFFGRLVDGALPGSQYNRATGSFSNLWQGVGGRAASLGASMFGGPLAGAAVNRLAGNWIDNGNPLQFRTPEQGGPGYMPIARETFPVSFGGGNLGLPGGMPTMPNVTATPPTPLQNPTAWTGLGTSTGNVVNGGALGSWASGSGPRQVAPLAAGIGRGGADVISGEAAQDYLRAMQMGMFANRQMHNYAV